MELHSDRNKSTYRADAMKFIITTKSITVIKLAFSMIILLFNIHPTYQQQDLCPKACNCDHENLTVYCKGSIGVNGLPHTLHPSTRRLTIIDGHTIQLSGLDNYRGLEYLDLAFNRLNSIDSEELSKDATLQYLNTSHNQISELKDSVVIKKIISQSINELPIEAANAEYVKLMKKLAKVNVIELNLNYNALTIIKSLTFFRWHKLQRLDLSNNLLTSLESDSLYGLIKLEHLNLRGNHLKEVPSFALQSTTRSPSQSGYSTQPISSDSSSLQTIDLSQNMMRSIDADAFNKMDKLQELFIESSSIETIHERSFSNLHTLRILNLDRNNLQDVPSNSFSQLGILRSLRLNHNNISHIKPNIFRDLIHLEDLQLQNQSIEFIPADAFNGLSAVRKLDLSSNENLTKIEQGAFQDLVRLTNLNLSHSSLPYIFNEFVQDTNIILDLRGNPLRCGCELRWLTRWLQNMNETVVQMRSSKGLLPVVQSHNTYSTINDIIHYPIETLEQLVNLTCTKPAALEGKSIATLPIKKLECLDPTSDLNVHIGFAILILITLILVTVCTINFCRNKNYLLVMLKSNLAPNHMSMMMPYKPSSRHEGYSYDMRKETNFDHGDYEPVDYNQPVYAVSDPNNDQYLYYGNRQT